MTEIKFIKQVFPTRIFIFQNNTKFMRQESVRKNLNLRNLNRIKIKRKFKYRNKHKKYNKQSYYS